MKNSFANRVQDANRRRLRSLAGAALAGLVLGAGLEWIDRGSLPWIVGREVRVAAAVLSGWALISPGAFRRFVLEPLIGRRLTGDPPSPSAQPYWVPLLMAVCGGVLWWFLPGTFFLVSVFFLLCGRFLRDWPQDERLRVQRLLFASLAVRLIVIFGYYPLASAMAWTTAWVSLDVPSFHVPVLLGDGADAITLSWAKARLWRGVWVSPSDLREILNPERSFLALHGDVRHLLPQTLLFYVFGVEPISARVLSALTGVLTGLFIYAAMRNRFGPHAAWWSAVLVSFWPTLFLWSLDALKEPYFLVAVAASAFFVSRFSERRQRTWLALALGLMAVGLSIRTRWLSPLLATTGLCLGGFVIQRYLHRLNWSKRVGLGLLSVAVVVVFLMGWERGRRLFVFYAHGSYTAQRNFASAKTGYRVWPAEYYTQPESRMSAFYRWRDMPLAWLKNLGHVLFEPLPRRRWGAKGWAFMVLTLPWWGALALATCGAWKVAVERDGVGWVWLAYIGLTFGFLAMFSGNVGTLIRHRDTASPILLMLAGLGISSLLKAAHARNPTSD